MKRVKLLRNALLVGVAAGLALVAGLVATHVSAQDEAVAVGSTTIFGGGEGSVDVRALNLEAPGLGAWSIDITYNPGVVAATACNAQQGGICNPAFAPDTVRITGATATGLQGDVTLGSITFRCVGSSGSSSLVVTIQTFADATIGAPQPIDAATQNGNVTCSAAPPPTEPPPPPPPPPEGGAAGASFVIAGATYRGDIAGGGTIEIAVSSDASGVSQINISRFSTLCGLISHIATFSPPTLIQNNLFGLSFIVGETEILVVGQFLSNGTIEGFIRTFPEDAACVQADRSYVASRVAPTSDVGGVARGPGAGLPDAGSGPDLGGGSTMNWYIAGLMGAGIAWLVAGLSGASIAFAGRAARRQARAERQPRVERQAVRRAPQRAGRVPEFVAMRPRAGSMSEPAPAPAQAPRATGLTETPGWLHMARLELPHRPDSGWQRRS